MDQFEEHNGTIVLVEDNPDDVELTLRAFRKKNILNPIVVLEDGEQAIDYLLKTDPADHPSLILLDIKLPKITGLEVLEHIRNHPQTRLLPVVVLTTSNEQEDIVRSYSLGANSYIRKPVDFGKFLEAVGQLGIYWLLLNEPGT